MKQTCRGKVDLILFILKKGYRIRNTKIFRKGYFKLVVGDMIQTIYFKKKPIFIIKEFNSKFNIHMLENDPEVLQDMIEEHMQVYPV